MARSTGPTPSTVRVVWERDLGSCARCGTGLRFEDRGYGWSVHHRSPRGMGGSGKGADEPALPAGERRIWIDEGGQARAVMVRTGISDGRTTEVTSEQLQPGMRVITDQRVAGAKG